MKVIAALITTFLATLLIYGSRKAKSQETNTGFEPIAIIELFTSQGCSSCPPADKLLAETIAQATKQNKKIYALSFHVDYWNRLGWKDPFSNRLFSERQAAYVSKMNINGAYTPQVIVNGENEFVGSNEIALNKSIEQALHTKSLVQFTSFHTNFYDNKTLKLNYVLEGNFKDCSINFALISLKETTKIKNGENGGRTLTNENIVLRLKTENIKNNGEGEAILTVPEGITKNNVAIIAFVQQNNDFKIIGAVMQNTLL